ncbi:MAG: hypothetical protein IT289_10850 [Oligoflexia bacterium]|nr:hypothetical protein [Oligoflexia bacterium]
MRWILIITVLFYGLSSKASSSLLPGDVILTHPPCYLCGLIQKTGKTRYSHAAIVVENKNGRPVAVQAASPTVSEVDVDFLIKHSRETPLVLRLKSVASFQRAELSAAARGFVGLPYDEQFHFGADRLYCSELIYFVFLSVFGTETPLQPVPMEFRPWTAEWARALGRAPPQGKWGLSPGDLERSSAFESFFLNEMR